MAREESCSILLSLLFIITFKCVPDKEEALTITSVYVVITLIPQSITYCCIVYVAVTLIPQSITYCCIVYIAVTLIPQSITYMYCCEATRTVSDNSRGEDWEWSYQIQVVLMLPFPRLHHHDIMTISSYTYHLLQYVIRPSPLLDSISQV